MEMDFFVTFERIISLECLALLSGITRLLKWVEQLL